MQCGRSYREEVDADDFTGAVKSAFANRLPRHIGRILAVREANPKKKNGWDTARYAYTASILEAAGVRDVYKQHKRGFVLDLDSPFVEQVEPGQAGKA